MRFFRGRIAAPFFRLSIVNLLSTSLGGLDLLVSAVLILDREANAMGRAREYGELFEALPREAAQRTIRFWRIRRQTGDVAAA